MRTFPLLRPLSADVTALFRFLLDVNAEQRVGAVLRVAGGWVRDTLLGVPSHDIDIAIETVGTGHGIITGEAFAASIARHQAALRIPTNTISVIKTNPDKSKHIETAQMTVFGVPLEFCHLRHDDYTAESRVPTVRSGTPLEDALRRDYTVNALFYNLHSGLVEDFTTGLADLEGGILRTPLAPKVTFMDDPLRLLRGMRFSGQLGFALDSDVLACAADSDVLASLRDKVSRERLGLEVAKMFGGERPAHCTRLLLDTGLLFHTILVEMYLKKAKGTKTAVGEVEYSQPLVEGAAQSAAAADALGHWIGCMAALLHMAAVPKGTDRAAATCFLLLAPLVPLGLLNDLAGPVAATRSERVVAVVMTGLKQPGYVAENAARLIAAFSTLWSTGPDGAAALVSGPATGPVRDALFDALVGLNAKVMPACAPALALAAFLFAQGCGEAQIAAALAHLRADVGLLAAPTGPLLIRGDELEGLIGIEKKRIATFLMYERRFLVHNPHATREDVLAFLQSKL